MPFPLLIPAVLGIVGLVGAGKTVKAVCDTSKANDIAASAQNRVDKANAQLQQGKDATNEILANYGKKKLETLDNQLQTFVDLFKCIKKVEIADSAKLDNLKIGKFSEVAIAELQHSCTVAHGALQGVGAGVVGGALTAFGAYSGTMMLASAGTGTAISALSGAAATNATLAWLGGGTLATGGMGIAGGTMVLGAMVAGPALLIFGSVLGASASRKLSEAQANMEQAETFALEIDGVCQKMAMIQDVAHMASDVLSSASRKLRRANSALEIVIADQGIDFSQYDASAKAVVFRGVKCAQLVKAIIDTPLLNESGELLGDVQSRLGEITEAIG